MPSVNPEGNDGSLTLEEAANAYANPETDEETGNGQAEDENGAQDDVEDSLESDDDDNADDEGQAEEETENDEPAAPAYVAPEAKVKLQDGSELTVAELIQGNLRDRDYRQKTEAVAAERKAYAAKSEQIQQLEQQVTSDREFMTELLQAIMPPKPDASLASVDLG